MDTNNIEKVDVALNQTSPRQQEEPPAVDGTVSTKKSGPDINTTQTTVVTSSEQTVSPSSAEKVKLTKKKKCLIQ